MGLLASAKKLRRIAKQQMITSMLKHVSNYTISSLLNHLQNPAAQEPFLGSAFP